MSKASLWFFAFAGCFVQFVVVYFVPMIIVLILSGWLRTPDDTLWQVFDYVLFGLISSALALVVSGFFPEADQKGRWVWTFRDGAAGLCHWMGYVSGQVRRSRDGFVRHWGGWMGQSTDHSARRGCCWYSLVMWWRLRRRRRETASGRMPHAWLAGVAVVCTVLIPSAKGAADGQINEALQKLVAMQRAWGPKMNSAGASLSLMEISRGALNGRTAVKYRMQASGLPADKIYSLVMWQTGGQPQTSLEGVTIDQTGTAICAGRPETCGTPDKPNDPIDVVMLGSQGEVKRVGLIATDGSGKAFNSVVPFPNRAADGRCTLEATLVTPNAEAVMLSVTGFKPGVTLNVEMNSEGETQHPSAKTDASGAYDWVVLPFKKGLTKGRAHVSVQSDPCDPALSFAWGAGSYV
ncbi:MAG: hypothetical protein M3N54_11805, partial [Acidobacteriota bacterium]|nr:hypothetical protein [Acidobacteriota bacterium]